jgi:hypothetical protein
MPSSGIASWEQRLTLLVQQDAEHFEAVDAAVELSDGNVLSALLVDLGDAHGKLLMISTASRERADTTANEAR